MRSILQPSVIWFGIFLFVLGCLLLVSTAVSLQSQHSGKPMPIAKVDLTENAVLRPEFVKTPAVNAPLRIAIAPIISPEKSLETYSGLAAYLGRKLQREPLLVRGKTYAHVNSLVRYGECDLAVVCTDAFVQGERNFGMKALVVPRMRGKITCQSYIVVSSASPFQSLLDLKGKRFGTCDMMSTSGWLFPRSWIRERNEDPNSFFSKNVITGSHDNSIYAITSDLVDGAAVHSLVYEQVLAKNPDLLKQLRVIDQSPAYGMPPFVVPPRTDPTFLNELRGILLNMNDDSEGKQVLAKMGIDAFEEPPADLYNSVKTLLAGEETHP